MRVPAQCATPAVRRSCLIALGLLVGCGDSASSEDGTSKERYIKQADAICREADRRAVRLIEGADPRDPADQRRLLQVSVKEAERLEAEFRRLPDPPGDPEEVEEMESTLAEGSDKGGELLAAAQGGDFDAVLANQRELLALNERFKEAAREYGLENCATDNDLPAPGARP
jgi:hypothetical protein